MNGRLRLETRIAVAALEAHRDNDRRSAGLLLAATKLLMRAPLPPLFRATTEMNDSSTVGIQNSVPYSPASWTPHGSAPSPDNLDNDDTVPEHVIRLFDRVLWEARHQVERS